MNLGRVIGTVVASTRYAGLEGVRLLVVQPLDSRMAPMGTTIVAADAVQSGPGDIIYYVNSREASLALDVTFVPVDACVVGHVDAVGELDATPTFADRGAP